MDQPRQSADNRTTWDPLRYERFVRERSRPFHDLIARIPDGHVLAAADLGCGTGALTRVLLSKWPEAEIWGVDSSEKMLAAANEQPQHERLHFVHDDLVGWPAPRPLDCIVSNAALHWVAGHAEVLETLVGRLSSTGVLAVQIPNNRSEPAYRVVEQLLASDSWRGRVPSDVLDVTVEAPVWYIDRLSDLGFETTVWETIYYHQLPGHEAVVEWLAGTTLRPALSLLDEDGRSELLAAITEGVAAYYPQQRFGVAFPFRRLFFVASRRDQP